MQLDGGLCILLYCPIESHRIFLTSNCIVMPCSVPVNCPAVICLPFMPCCLSKESTSSELWTPVQSLPLIHLPLLLVYLLQTITFHTIRLILCYSKPVSLTTSLFVGAKSWVCVVQVSALLATPVWRFLPPSGSITSVSTEGKLADVLFTPYALGYQQSAMSSTIKVFLAPLPGG